MTEGTQVSNIAATDASIFTYITSLSISLFCSPFPDNPSPDHAPDLGFQVSEGPIRKRAGSLQLRY